jgi:hypothetical protein
MNEPPTKPDTSRHEEKEPPAASEAMNGLARTPAYWFSLGDVEAFRRIEGLAFDWPSSNPLDGIDPYLAWLDVSRFLGTNLDQKDGVRFPDTIPMLVKVSSAEGLALAGGGFGTFVVPRKNVLKIRAGSTIPLLGLMSLTIDSTPTIGLPGKNNGNEFRFILDTDGLPVHAARALGKPVIAIIDDGCPFARVGLRLGAGTRVLRLWDQNPGSEWDRPALDAALAAGVVAVGPADTIDEDRCYAHLGLDLVGETFRHGAHMLGLTAGDPDPWRDDDAAIPPDAAAQADVLFVQLPRATMTDTSGGSLPPR